MKIQYVFIIVVLFAVSILSAQNFTKLDTVYTPSDCEVGELEATICIPENPNGAAIIIAHGIFINSPKMRHSMQIWGDTLAANGYVTMNLDYYPLATGPLSIYPNQVTTFKLAVEFLRRNKNRFQLFTDQIVGFGMSGGAFHWGQSIIWNNEDEFFKTDPAIDDHVDAAILLYGAFDNYNNVPSWWPGFLHDHFKPNPDFKATKGHCIANVKNISIPVLLLHGTKDYTLDYQQSVQLYDSLTALGKECQLVPFEGKGHGFDLTAYEPPHQFREEGLAAKDSMLAFLDRTLDWTPTSVENDQIIEQFQLRQNYPNPFNPSTTITFSLPLDEHTTLKVYDLLGRTVTTLVDGHLNAGQHNIRFDASHLVAGIYFYRLQSGDFSQIRKFTLVK
jgi:acetyl esterase/lipase